MRQENNNGEGLKRDTHRRDASVLTSYDGWGHEEGEDRVTFHISTSDTQPCDSMLT